MKKTTGRKKKKYLIAPEHLPTKLKIIRRHHKLTQFQMIEIVNPLDKPENRAKISQFEKGQREPHISELLNYARFAGVTIDHLADDEMDLPEHFCATVKSLGTT
jgi:transcriptional regulator with XRE-family HTH domain